MKLSKNSADPLIKDRASEILDILKQGLVIREQAPSKSIEDLSDLPEPSFEILMEDFWGYLIGNELFKQINQSSHQPKTPSELEQYFTAIDSKFWRVSLEFLLWLVDSQTTNPKAIFTFCELVFGSAVLPSSAVWRIGIWATEDLQRSLVNHARRDG